MERSMPTAIAVIGAGGHGRETVGLIRDAEARTPGQWELLGVVDDAEPPSDKLSSLNTAWLGPIQALKGMDTGVSVAIGDGRLREKLSRQARALGCAEITLVHHTASIGPDVELADGCYIGAMTVITTQARLGTGTQVNVGCTISHDVVIGDYVTLAPGVHVAGGSFVEDGATIFTGAVVTPGIRIGRGAVVGAGAVVIRDVRPGETVFGVPARPTSTHPY